MSLSPNRKVARIENLEEIGARSSRGYLLATLSLQIIKCKAPAVNLQKNHATDLNELWQVVTALCSNEQNNRLKPGVKQILKRPNRTLLNIRPEVPCVREWAGQDDDGQRLQTIEGCQTFSSIILPY